MDYRYTIVLYSLDRRRHGIKCGYADFEARRAVARGPNGRERGSGFWGGDNETIPTSYGGCGSAEGSPTGSGAPENFQFGAFWDKIASQQCKIMVYGSKNISYFTCGYASIPGGAAYAYNVIVVMQYTHSTVQCE